MFDFRTIMLLLFLSQNLCGQNDIFELARRGSVQEVQAVVEETPSVLNAKDQRGSTPLVLACYYNNIDIVRYIIQNIDDVNGTTKDGSPLMASAVKGYNAISELLIAAGADVNLQDANQTTALHYAVMFKNYDLVLMLLEAGANPNHKNNVGQSPKDFAVMQNDKRMNILLKLNQ
jgi:ankyrin repeat protein